MPNDLSSPTGVLDVPAATTAVLHGMMTTLSEVLGGIDGRIASLERQLREARAEAGSPRALAQTVEAAVARLVERMEALEALVTAEPPPAPPQKDESLHTAVEALRHSVDALAVRPARDDDLHHAVAALADAVAAIPPPPEPQPFPDFPPPPGPDLELHAKVAALAEAIAAIPPPPDPPAPPGPDDPVRLGITSLHERLSVLLELAAQPTKPDDAVRLGLGELQAEIAALRQPADASPDPLLFEIGERLRRLEERLAQTPEPPPPDERLTLLLADLAAVNHALTDHPAASLTQAMERVEAQVASFVSQPGPGPAMAMVAAGLAERFESRTDALVDLLTSITRTLTDVQVTLVASADMAGTLERVRTVVEGEQGDVAAMRDALRNLYDSVERHGSVSGQVAELMLENRAALGREIDRLQGALAGQSADLTERVQAALEAAASADTHAADMGRSVERRIDEATARLIADVQALVATGQDPARLDMVADRISESVRRESELLTQRVAALSLAVDSLRTGIDDLVEETSNSIGRKATEVGRKLAADLGIRGKKPPANGTGTNGTKHKSLGPGA